MSQYHLKRLPAPKNWKIMRKESKYIAKPHPGGHSMEMSMPLHTVLIGLGHATTKREVKHIIKHSEVQVDGKKRHSFKHPFGFMDVMTLPQRNQHYRMVLDAKGLEAVEIKPDEAKTKLVKIVGKTSIKGGKTQLNTHDGRNIAVEKGDYKIGDSLLIEVPSQKIKSHLKLDKGAMILLIKGAHQGAIGNAEDIDGRKIMFKEGDEVIETKRAYAFVVGKDKPAVTIQNG